MDTVARRCWWTALLLGGAAWTVLRRRSGILVSSMILYYWSESLFGITPLKAYELTDLLAGNKEASIAAAALVVAIVSVSAFRRVKRLDLELAAASDIKEIIGDCQELLTRNRLYCEALLRIQEQYLATFDGDSTTPEERVRLRSAIRSSWSVLTESVKQTQQDRKGVWDLVQRIIDLDNLHSAILHSKILAPWFLERGQRHLEEIAGAMIVPIPGESEDVGTFMRFFLLNGAQAAREYLDVDRKHRNSVYTSLGGASAIGTTSVAPASAITAIRMAIKLWSKDMRE